LPKKSDWMIYYILDADHQPVPVDDVLTWGRWFENFDNRCVARTEVAPGIVVSTICLGIDHNFFGGPPILFETMTGSGYGWDGEVRYASWAEAERGHWRIVEHIRSLLQAPSIDKRSYRSKE
jgi:hypothetical protein